MFLHAAFRAMYIISCFFIFWFFCKTPIHQSLITLTKIFPAVFAIHSNNAQVIKIRSMDLPYFILDERRGSVDDHPHSEKDQEKFLLTLLFN